METKKFEKLVSVLSSQSNDVIDFLICNGAYEYNKPEQYDDSQKLQKLTSLLDLAYTLELCSNKNIDYSNLKITWGCNVPYVDFSLFNSLIPESKKSMSFMCFANVNFSEATLTYFDKRYVSAFFMKLYLDSLDFNLEKVKTVRNFKTYLMIDNNTGYYKIGKSLDCSIRETTLQSQNPSIKLICKCNKDIEHKLHQKYAAKRVRGEWFSLTDKDVSDIMDLF